HRQGRGAGHPGPGKKGGQPARAGAQDRPAGGQEPAGEPGDGLLGSFSAAFDLLSHEYGWTDEYILDLPLCRLRQCIAAASARRRAGALARLKLAELQVKTVCSFIGAQAWIDTDQTGGRNPLVEAAQALDFTGGIDPAEAELDALRGPRVADRIEDDSRLQLSRPVAA